MPKKTNRAVRGGEPRGLRPDWRPLLNFAPDEIPEFMWMYRVELEDGSVVEAYKHSSTRRYLHLDSSRRAYQLIGGTTYEEVDAGELLAKVLERDQTGAIIVRRNEWIGGQGITWARSATRHRVPRAQTHSVIRRAGICFEDTTTRGDEPRLYFFGDAEDGMQLEILTVKQADDELFVIHSMPMRKRFEDKYREALKWQR